MKCIIERCNIINTAPENILILFSRVSHSSKALMVYYSKITNYLYKKTVDRFDFTQIYLLSLHKSYLFFQVLLMPLTTYHINLNLKKLTTI